ncbi:MAG: glutamate-ammonia-ligase adenylyltransferase [Gammaproteobacteria bacterium]|nr:MAG: glutamate-ammonia-ligase adenylyltransferase [Gammaproteobacteria bacterium]
MSDSPRGGLPAGRPPPPVLREEAERAWAAFVEARVAAGLPPPAEAATLGQGLFAASGYLAWVLQRHPDWWAPWTAAQWTAPFDAAVLAAAEAAEPDLAAEDEAAFMAALRRFRHRMHSRIAVRDLAGWAPLAETLTALSRTADRCLELAYRRAAALQEARFGKPRDEAGGTPSLVVLALGKLGGEELNFSSDVDLIFAYPEEGESSGGRSGRCDNHRWFLGQAQSIIRYLAEQTADGFAYRVDTRLRPFGHSGPLAASFDFLEQYYMQQGRDWERYALIKARPVCGEPADRRALLELLRPFVFRRYLDYQAFAALREMKAMIAAEVRRKGLEDDIKRGAGGIREIEFIGQAFQLIRGGREPALRARSILTVLDRLAERQVLDPAVVMHLKEAYALLRAVENRLQMVADRQVHRLPKDERGRARLAYAMGYDAPEPFEALLARQRAAVAARFQALVFGVEAPEAEDPRRRAVAALADQGWPPAETESFLAPWAGAAAGAWCEALRRFADGHAARRMSRTARERLLPLLPLLFDAVAAAGGEAATLARVLAVLEAVLQRPVYLALLLEYPRALQQLVRLCAASDWLAAYIARHPAVLDVLVEPRSGPLPDRDALRAELRAAMAALQEEDEERRLDALRHFKQEQVLRIAALDVLGGLPLMKVSDQLTWLAEAVLETVVELAEADLEPRFGRPRAAAGEPAFGVIAYGKLGGIELGYASDLDLVFVYRGEGQTDGPRVLDNALYYARLVQRIVHWLTTRTSAGVLYEVDMRLRPDGASGPLVCTLEAFDRYQQERAWTWEHQALVRARMVCGPPALCAAFADTRRAVLTRRRDRAALQREVREMRERMRRQLSKGGRDGLFDLKYDRGGLGDIEFIVQYLILGWSCDHPEVASWSDIIRQLEALAAAGVIEAGRAAALDAAWRHFREIVHRRALQGESARIEPDARTAAHIEAVAAAWRDLLERPPPDAFSATAESG